MLIKIQIFSFGSFPFRSYHRDSDIDLTLIKEYDGLNNNTIYCPNQFCELQNGKILCISGENAGGTGSFFVFSPDDINNGEFKSFTEDEIMRTLVKINETKFAVGLENGDVKFYQF